jgi:hypothetical protein
MDESMASRSSLLISAIAASRVIRNLLRRTSADSGEVCVIVIGRTEVSATLMLDNACRMLLLKGVGLVLVFCASDGDFMVVTVVVSRSSDLVNG